MDASARVRVDRMGRILIPVELRRKLGMQPGSEIVLRLENHELRLYTLEEAVRRAQEIVRRYVPPGVSLSEELIADRKAEAERERRRP